MQAKMADMYDLELSYQVKLQIHKMRLKQGSGAEDSVGPHSGRPVLLWPTMKIWIVCFHF